MGILRDLWLFMRERKKSSALAPIIIVFITHWII